MSEAIKKPVIRVRYAPSPTGKWHLGGARAVIYNWLFARAHNGVFIIRVEDTDTERSVLEHEQGIFEGLEWLGIDYDEGPTWQKSEEGEWKMGSKGNYGPYRQSERTASYKTYLEQLLAEGKAYYCYCSKEDLEASRQAMLAEGLPPKYSGHCRNLSSPPEGKSAGVIRVRTPEVKIQFNDLIRGSVVFDASLFGDMVIAKNIDSPLYNFAVVVDDELMEITHVIRGEDHIANTPKQIILQQALGFRPVIYAHLPLVLNPDRSKMSKRYAETSVLSYRDEGYLPEAINNFLTLLGWHPKDDQEIFKLTDIIHDFSLERVQKSGAIFNEEKLQWINQQYIKKMELVELRKQVEPFIGAMRLGASDELLINILRLQRERMTTLKDFVDLSAFFINLPEYDSSLLIWKDSAPADVAQTLEDIHEKLNEIDPWERPRFTTALDILTSEKGRGTILWPLRVALSGLRASPDPMDILEALGKEESLHRINLAVQKLKK